jgi:hypothetical protein
MKHTRKIAKNPIFCSFLIGLIFLSTGCTKEQILNPNGNRSEIKYSGEELYEGIFFAKGEVAEAIPTIKNSSSYFQVHQLSQKSAKSMDNQMTEVMNEIETKNPNYFDEFKESIATQDHLIIEETLKDATELLYETSIDMYLSEQDQSDLKEIVEGIDLNNHLNSNGSINYESLSKEITKDFKVDNNEKAACVFAGVVFVAAAYVLVAHAAAAMTYVAVAWVAEYYAAVDREKTVTRAAVPRGALTMELMVNDLATSRAIRF